MNFFKRVASHLRYFAETYFILPLALLALIGMLHFVSFLTGRPVLDDPGVLAGTMYNAIRIVIAFALVGIGQQLLYGYRSQADPESPMDSPRTTGKLSDDIYDAAVTFLMFVTILYFLWH